ncbi:hypothetical protein Scep_001439 [Stephania cephalantha]|uniref:Probable purine permease n=1 Tax=Stephania cephalantha TaxID=152367 RepID=A0AAP0L9C2_9MAGN
MASLDEHQITVVGDYDETAQQTKLVTYHALPTTSTTYSSTHHQTKWWLLLLYCAFMAIGAIGSPSSQKLYYLHGGNLIWLATWVQSAGFPILLIPLSFTYLINLSKNKSTGPSSKPFTFMDSNLFACAAAAGVVLGLSSFFYSSSLRYLPVSTSSLLFSTQLAFTALFAFIMVRQRFTFYSVNSVALMTMGAAALVLQTSGDRSASVGEGEYLLGFLMMMGSMAMSGLMMPLVELGYSKSTVPVNYAVVMQFQVVQSLFANLFCTIGMLINNDFQGVGWNVIEQKITTEAREYELGEYEYYGVILGSIVISQVLALGIVGVVHTSSSLFAGMVTALMLPVTEVFAVLAYNEKFTGEKGLALALCLWGFSSYFIGEYKKTNFFN